MTRKKRDIQKQKIQSPPADPVESPPDLAEAAFTCVLCLFAAMSLLTNFCNG